MISAHIISTSQYRCRFRSSSGVMNRCSSSRCITSPSSVPSTTRPLDAPRSIARYPAWELTARVPPLASQMRPRARRERGWPLGGLARAVPRGAEREHRIERRAAAAPRLRHQRPHVRVVRALQRALGHDHVARLLMCYELVVIDQTRLRVRLLELIDRLEQRLDRILEIVALVDHVRRIETGKPLALGLHELVEDQEQRIGLDRSRREIVVPVHRVVEVEATQLSRAEQARDDELDVRARQMVPEIDETLRTLAERLREQQRRAPVLNDSRVERRLVRLVLGEQPPIVWNRRVYLPQAFPYALEASAQRHLTREIR